VTGAQSPRYVMFARPPHKFYLRADKDRTGRRAAARDQFRAKIDRQRRWHRDRPRRASYLFRRWASDWASSYGAVTRKSGTLLRLVVLHYVTTWGTLNISSFAKN